MARILWDSNAPGMSWWDPVFLYEQLEEEWNKSLETWINLLKSKTEDQVFEEVEFTSYDGGKWRA